MPRHKGFIELEISTLIVNARPRTSEALKGGGGGEENSDSCDGQEAKKKLQVKRKFKSRERPKDECGRGIKTRQNFEISTTLDENIQLDELPIQHGPTYVGQQVGSCRTAFRCSRRQNKTLKKTTSKTFSVYSIEMLKFQNN